MSLRRSVCVSSASVFKNCRAPCQGVFGNSCTRVEEFIFHVPYVLLKHSDYTEGISANSSNAPYARDAMQESMIPQQALQKLAAGNQRFVDAMSMNRNYGEQVQATENGQYPYAVLLSCIDSRMPAEIVFDQGIGDISSIRIAGNIVNTDILGSLEFACKLSGSKVIVVLGLTHCGAAKGACDHVETGNVEFIHN